MALLSILATGPAGALERWVVGGDDGQPWDAAGSRLDTVDVDTRPGWLRPDSLSAQDNLSLTSVTRGGGVTSPQGVMRLQEVKDYAGSKGRNLMNNMVDGDPETVFEMDSESARGTLTGFVVLDLGAVVAGARQIRFYPRAAHQDRFIQGFDLAINDGDVSSRDANGGLLWQPVVRDDDNGRATVVVDIAPQPVRFVRLQSRTTLPWEVAEIEVYGGGFVRQAAYVSPVVDVGGDGGLANLGRLAWSGLIDPLARVVVRTRSGASQDPNRYFELTVDGADTLAIPLPDPQMAGTAREQYDALPEGQRRVEPDLTNWSSWSAPYQASGEPVQSPSPRRYFQVRVDLSSFDYRSGAQLESLGVTYSTPVNAHRLVASLSPLRVMAGQEVTFDYSLYAEVRGEDRGFDALRVTTPVEASDIGDVRIDGEPVALDSVRIGADHFLLYFPPFTAANQHLSFSFVGRVLVFGSEFSTSVFSRALPDEVAQSPDGDDSELAVSVVLNNSLLASISAQPRVLSPNGDGVNDAATITYQVLKILEPAPVLVTIHDLSGRRVRALEQRQTFGVYRVDWDGRDDAGRRVPPGTYLYRVEVQSETVTDARTGVLGVAY